MVVTMMLPLPTRAESSDVNMRLIKQSIRKQCRAVYRDGLALSTCTFGRSDVLNLVNPEHAEHHSRHRDGRHQWIRDHRCISLTLTVSYIQVNIK